MKEEKEVKNETIINSKYLLLKRKERCVLLETENIPKADFGGDKMPEPNMWQEPTPQPSSKSSMPMIGGILLILAGVFALLLWISVILTIDAAMVESAIDLSQLQELDPSWTAEKLKDMLVLCGTAFSVLALFPILGGILAIKKKLWGIALGCSILGLSTFIVVIPGILCLIGLILIVISRKEFQ